MNKKQIRSYINEKVKKRTDEIEIGGVYFLSSFRDKEGAFVRVLSKSKEENLVGWPSKVEYEILELVDQNPGYHYIGKVGTCNATNLYDKREHASVAYKFGK